MNTKIIVPGGLDDKTLFEFDHAEGKSHVLQQFLKNDDGLADIVT